MNEYYEHAEILNRFLRKWEKYLNGPNYNVEFGFQNIKHDGERIRKEEALANLLNLTDISDVEFIKVNKSILKAGISNLIKTGGFDNFSTHFNDSIRNQISNKMLPKYYDLLQHYVNFQGTNIYKLENVPDAPCFDIFWSYTYMISDHNRDTSVIIWGGAAD